MGAGLFHTARRAVDDCRALLEVLTMPLAGTERPALASLLARARRNTVRIWAEGAPHDLKDELKERKYRWNDGSDGRPRSWHIEIDEDSLDAEIKFLRQEIYRRDVELLLQSITSLTRFSDRS
jgi:DNA polymerase III subunit epsilon